MKIRYLLIISIILIILTSCTPSKKFLQKKKWAGKIDSNYIKVLILNTGKEVTVESKSRIRISNLKTRKVLFDKIKAKLTIPPYKIKRPVIIESWQSPILINNKPYRGLVEIHNVIGKLYVINVVKIEEYLFSVVPSEIPSGWNYETLKAQAVAARTYAYYHLNKNKTKNIFNMDATTNFQVYKGILSEKPEATRAVINTAGEIIMNNFKPIISYFHSTCGGHTISDKYVWSGEGHEYLKGVKCNYCKESPYYNWESTIKLYNIRKFLKKKYKNIGRIKKILFIKKFGRIISVKIEHKFGKINLSGNNFRLLFPPKIIKSMFFKSKKLQDGLKLYGQGWGHGVGMCQWGAKGMGDRGINYKNIIKFYYTKIKIVNLKNKNFRNIVLKKNKIYTNYN